MYIVTGDNHLRSDVPLCRLETPEQWIEFQFACLMGIVTQANTYHADIIFTGDTFDVPRVSPEILSILVTALSYHQGTAWFLSGNHEKAYHREENVGQSSIGVIKALAGNNTGKIRYCDVTEKIVDGRFEHSSRISDLITVVHTLTFPDEASIPFAADAVTADYLFDNYDTPFILSGDMHHSFVQQKGERWVINPGCMSIQSAGELEYTPIMYILDTGIRTDVSISTDKERVYRQSKVTITPVNFPNPQNMLTREHITLAKERDARIAAAIEMLHNNPDGGALSFIDELQKILSQAKHPALVDMLLTELKQEAVNG